MQSLLLAGRQREPTDATLELLSELRPLHGAFHQTLNLNRDALLFQGLLLSNCRAIALCSYASSRSLLHVDVGLAARNIVDVCPTVCTDPPRAHATRRSAHGFFIKYFRHLSSYPQFINGIVSITYIHWILMRRMDRPSIWIDPLVFHIDQSRAGMTH